MAINFLTQMQASLGHLTFNITPHTHMGFMTLDEASGQASDETSRQTTQLHIACMAIKCSTENQTSLDPHTHAGFTGSPDIR